MWTQQESYVRKCELVLARAARGCWAAWLAKCSRWLSWGSHQLAPRIRPEPVPTAVNSVLYASEDLRWISLSSGGAEKGADDEDVTRVGPAPNYNYGSDPDGCDLAWISLSFVETKATSNQNIKHVSPNSERAKARA
jgi:hypothetical protein